MAEDKRKNNGGHSTKGKAGRKPLTLNIDGDLDDVLKVSTQPSKKDKEKDKK